MSLLRKQQRGWLLRRVLSPLSQRPWMHRCMSTEGQEGPEPDAPPPPSGPDYLTMFQGRGLTRFGPYTAGRAAKIRVSKYILKHDIVSHFRGCNLQPENLKFVYSPAFKQEHVLVDCDSFEAFNTLERHLDRSGRLGFRRPRLEPAPKVPWNFADAYLKGVPRGRTLIVVNVPQNADAEDLERFFEGYTYDPSCATYFTIPREQGVRKQVIKYGVVAFSTQLEALRARRERNGEIFVNKKVTLRFFQ